jgi:Skp family chaperone for outer membrane proteins
MNQTESLTAGLLGIALFFTALFCVCWLLAKYADRIMPVLADRIMPVLVVAGAVLAIYEATRKPTPQEATAAAAKAKAEELTRQRRQEATAAQDAASKAQSAETKRRCGKKAECAAFAAARQACATAGNFETCMRIKVADLPDALNACLNDGNYAWVPKAEMPNDVECFFAQLGATRAANPGAN